MKDAEKINRSIALLNAYGDLKEVREKQWLLDQIARVLLAEGYIEWASVTESVGVWDTGSLSMIDIVMIPEAVL